MKVKVLAVEDKSFEKDGKAIPGVGLTYEVDGKRETRISWIPPVASAALAWKPDDEVEIEVYTDKKDRAAFKIPGQQGTGGKGLSYDERRLLDEASSEAMDRRTSLMQAVAFHTGTPTLDGTVIQTAARYLGWLRAQRSVGAGSARGRVDSAPTGNVEAGAGVAQSAEHLERAGSRPGGAGTRQGQEAAGSNPVPGPASTSSPVQGRGQAAAGEGAYREEVPSQAADSGAGIPSAPAAVTNSAGDPSPPRVEAPASPGDGQRGATVIPPSPGTTPEKCSHPSWSPAPNEAAAKRGLMVCDSCGAAEKRKASV